MVKRQKDRQHNGQKKKDKRKNKRSGKKLHRKLKIEQHEPMAKRKRTNSGQQNTTQETKDQATRTNGQKKKNKQWSTKHYTGN
jgi:hypothetical protein